MLRQGNEIRFDDRWPSVRGTVSNLFYQRNVTKSEWQELFMLVHSIALWDEDGAMKVRCSLSGEITRFIKEAQKRVMQHQEDSALLKAYITEWRQFFTQCDYLPLPFQPLETVLGKAHLSGPKKNNLNESIVRKLMLDSWNTNIFQNIKHRLQESAMKLVQYERNGDVIDSHLVIGVRESYVNLCTQQDAKLQIYQEHFEKAYLDSTEAFYRTRAVQYMREHGVQNYMKYASTKLGEEQTRAERYLETRSGVESVNRLVDRCVDVLVTSFKEEILAECQPMIRSYDTDKLKLLFNLMDRVSEGVAPMLSALEDHIRQAGLENMHASKATIVTDSEKYVERLLHLFNKFTDLVEKAFNNDHRFLTSRDKAYKDVVNDTSVFHLDLPGATRMGPNARGNPESKCPELLANYCDMLLRKTPLSRKFTSEEIERRLREVLLVLKYVQNKDVFIRYHKAHLTRRLILDTSADDEIEESMVEWLREVGMPADVVNKLARMFQDIKVSNDLNTEFKETIRNNNTDMADTINIKILNSGAWMRQSERIGVSLPRELEDYIPQVEEFYKKKHNGRKLQWNHLMSNGLITMDNELGRYDVEVTTFQMAVLYAWNSRRHDRISFESLRLATGLPENELRRTVWSLVQNPKLKRQLLLSNPEPKSAKDFTDNTEFRLNPEFAVIKNGRAQKRGKINLIGRLQLQTERVREEENEAILKLRVLRIQEAIVKIMKMRKRLRNAELYTELVELLKNMFVPSKKMIKEQIEWLIENKYLHRDDNDLNVFHYVA